ncbi:MAG: ShlB/FhaC/HecB family hemolysin secretion/activation protein, partial [Waterburya sp.]
MFAESRSNRPSANLYCPTPNNPSLISLQEQLNSSLSDRQLVLSPWEFWLYQAVIFSSQLATNSKSQEVKKLGAVLSYSFLFLLAMFRCPTIVIAQSFEPITPDRPQPPSPRPLPPNSNPLDDSLKTPPTPESVWDIPGKIVVEKFTFAGNTVFSQAELNKAIAKFRGKPISFAQLV